MMFIGLRPNKYRIFVLLLPFAVCHGQDFECPDYEDGATGAIEVVQADEHVFDRQLEFLADAQDSQGQQGTNAQGTMAPQSEPEAAPVQSAEQPVKPVKKHAKKHAKQTPKPNVEPEEIAGIDTVDLDQPQGNWLFKRLWWERAEEKYEEIRALVAHILELRLPFLLKRTDVDRTVLDPFYLQVAHDRGALAILLGDISEFLATEVQEGELSEREREMRDQLRAENETLEGLQKNIQEVLSYDHELDVAIGTLMEQLNRASEYEQEAWALFKEIGRVLDDNKAREYVLKMKHIQRNIKEIEDYIKERFAVYFDQLIATMKESVTNVTVAMEKLTEKGIDLKETLNQIKEQAHGNPHEILEEAHKPQAVEDGFLARWIINPISSFFGAIWSGIAAVVKWPYNLFFGSSKVNEAPASTSIDIISDESQRAF